MTESERDLLMPFLRNLVQSRDEPGDEAAANLIRNALGRQPNACYLLVQRAMTLEVQLASARSRIDELEGRSATAAVAAHVSVTSDFLNPVVAGWGENPPSRAMPTTSKRLYDFFQEMKADRADDLESRALIFISKNNGKIWLGIFTLVAIVVALREKLI